MTAESQFISLSGRAALKLRKDDLYETPAVATEALLRAEKLPRRLWEPAAGRGAIVDVLRANGHEVFASDLVDYGDPTHFARRDFLMEQKPPDGCEGIVTNPPFKLGTEFVEHGLELCPLVIMLLRLAFLESERRNNILDTGKLARVYPFRNRLPMMHREGYAPTTHNYNSAIAFAWFVFSTRHTGPPIIKRISWEAVGGFPANREQRAMDP